MVLDSGSIRRILHVSHRDRVLMVELRRLLYLPSKSAQVIQRSLRWFVHVAKRPDGEPNAASNNGAAFELGRHE